MGRVLLIPPAQRLGLSREQAAEYIGVSPDKFDEMAADGRMPKPKIIDRRKVWDRFAIEKAFRALPDRHGSGGRQAETADGDVWDQVTV
jgi:predicted DNA-binding transcriptional regulator AlpA